jgi:catechol 2,3-dioxygenase-like lactoylglutathione lyase family enzyme
MNLKFINPVVFVKDIRVSKTFYAETLGLKVVGDHGPFVLFEDHFSIHQAEEPAVTVWKADSPSGTDQPQGRHNLLLYFETNELEEAFAHLKDQVKLITIERKPGDRWSFASTIRMVTWSRSVNRYKGMQAKGLRL